MIYLTYSKCKTSWRKFSVFVEFSPYRIDRFDRFFLVNVNKLKLFQDLFLLRSHLFSFGFSPYIIDVFCSLHFCTYRENKVTLRSVAFVIKMSVCATFSSDFGVGNCIVQHKTESTNCFNASRSVIRNPLHQ